MLILPIIQIHFNRDTPNTLSQPKHTFIFKVFAISRSLTQFGISYKLLLFPAQQAPKMTRLGQSSKDNKCKGNHLLQQICLDQKCQDLMYCCTVSSCPSCSQLHANCSITTLSQIYSSLIANENQHLTCFHQILEMQDTMVSLIEQSKKQVLSNLSTAGISSLNKKLLFNMFVQQNRSTSLKLKIAQVMTEFQEKQIQLSRQRQHIKEYNQLLVAKSLTSLKTILRTKDTLIQKVTRLPSNIVSDYHDIEYIRSLIGSFPKEFLLLFRASEHAFSAASFHSSCDHIANTLVLIKTQFGKCIVAFSATPWFSGKSNYSSDDSRRSFIASLGSRTRLSLSEQKYAIFCDENHGPCFGRGFDLKVLDKCNEHANNYMFCPYSYSLNAKQIDHKAIWSDFCGSPQGYRFKIREYEVFKVTF